MPETHRDVCILQPGYFPWLGYFDQAKMADVFVLYDDIQFDKGGWRNRNRILFDGKPMWLTVPVLQSGRFGQTVRDVQIAGEQWPRKHLGTLRACYGRAPFFGEIYPAIEAHLLGRTYRWLVDLNRDIHTLFCTLLGVPENTCYSSTLGVPFHGRTQRLVDICRSRNATRYISADASRSYMQEELWRSAGIDLVYQSYPHPIYAQFGKPFVSHLSAIDALMFCGPAARAFVGISHDKHRRASV